MLMYNCVHILQLVAALIKKDLVKSHVEAKDHRMKRLKLTSRAIEIIEKIEPFRMRSNQRLFANLSEEECKRFLSFLEICLQTLQKDRRGGAHAISTS